VLASCGSTTTYAALVNGTSISRSSLDQELSDISQNKPFVQAVDQQQGSSASIEGASPGSYNKAFVAQLLTQRIEYELIRQELVRRKALPGPSDLQPAQSAVTQRYTLKNPGDLLQQFPRRYQDTLVARQADVTALGNTLKPASDPSDAALRQYYDTHQSSFITEVCVRHILLTDKDLNGQIDDAITKADADKVKAQLDGGADFATLAKTHSKDTTSGVNGGQLKGSAQDGCLTSSDAGQLVPEFQQAMLTLPLNQISNPVKTQFGYHIIQVTARPVAPFNDQTKATIRQQLQQPGQQAFTDLLNKLIQDAKVKVSPEFGTFDKKGNPSAGTGPSVVPPAVPNPHSGG
jgi:parvulin-like peptidyl-prolyl isomerase